MILKNILKNLQNFKTKTSFLNFNHRGFRLFIRKFSSNHILRKEQYNDRYLYFDEVKYFIENNDLNEITQKKLEIMGIDYNLTKKKNNNLNENKPIFELIENKQIKLLFIEVNEDLKSKIKVLKMKDEHSKYFDKLKIVNLNKINKNSKQRIMCSKLYSELNPDKIIFILLGNALDIINNPSIENNFNI